MTKGIKDSHSPHQRKEEQRRELHHCLLPLRTWQLIKAIVHLQHIPLLRADKKVLLFDLPLASFCHCRLSSCMYNIISYYVIGLSRLKFQKALSVCCDISPLTR